MKKIFFGLLLCISANAFGMDKAAKVLGPRRSIKRHLSPHAAQQQWDVLGRGWVLRACETECKFGAESLENAQKDLSRISSALSNYIYSIENAGMTIRHIEKVRRLESKLDRFMASLEKEERYMERFRDKNQVYLERYMARQIKTLEGLPIECHNPEAEARKVFEAIMAQALQKKD